MAKSDEFSDLVFDTLLPDFCSASERQIYMSGFKKQQLAITSEDRRDFMRAWNAGLLSHQGRGQYLIGGGSIKEQFFWSGRRDKVPRSCSLWLEPFITVASIARLHLEHGWPIELIVSQSSDWAFDLVACRADGNPRIAGEIKKSVQEVSRLIMLMKRYADSALISEPVGGPRRNAYKKVVSLRTLRAPILWIVGPHPCSHVFKVNYNKDASLEFIEIDSKALHFDGMD